MTLENNDDNPNHYTHDELIRQISKRNLDDRPINIIKSKMLKHETVTIAAPMVRYSKLPFRALLRHYKVDVVYSPMMLAREFVRNQVARDSEFTTNLNDHPLQIQIGVNNSLDIIRMVDLISDYVDGIGINCGCPIKDQVREGIGAALMTQPENVAQMVKVVKEKYGDKISIEVKIRIHKDINETIRFVKLVEVAGVDYITVHGRRKSQRNTEPVNLEAIKTVVEHAKVPIIANGDCFSYEDIDRITRYTGVAGVMAARGLLENPALFAGFKVTPWHAVERFWDYSTAYGLPFRLTQHHFSEMLVKLISRQEKSDMNTCNNLVELIAWFDERFILKRSNEEGFATAVEVPWRKEYLRKVQLQESELEL